MPTLVVEMLPVSNGVTMSEDSFNVNSPTTELTNRPGMVRGVVTLTDAQVLCVRKYLAHMNKGTNTAAVETAINAL